MDLWAKIKKMSARKLAVLIIIISFIVAYLFPGMGESATVSTILAVLGILFGLLVGFFFTGLWTRLTIVKEMVGEEVSGWMDYHTFASILGQTRKKWFEEQRKIMDKYLKTWMSVEWEQYEAADPIFRKMLNSLGNLGNIKTNRDSETYSNLLGVTTNISSARERLDILGSDKLSKLDWVVMVILAFTLLGALFYSKTSDITSTIFTALLAATIIILLFVVRDLNDLSIGENVISFEPYEKVFDVWELARFYPKKFIKEGRVTLPKDKKYRIG